MCSLPTVTNGSFYSTISGGLDSIAFWDANVDIAKNKGWKVYSVYSTYNEILKTNGKYVCGLDRSQYITLKFNNSVSVVSPLMKNLSIGVSGTQYVNIVANNVQSTKVLDTVISINGTQSIKQILQNNNLNNCLELYIYGVVTSLKLDTIPYLTEIDASKNKVLERITGEGDTNLTKINVYGCSKLKEINLVNTKLSTLSLYGCTALETLVLNGGELASLSISGNTALKTLTCSGNKLSTLDISKNTKIETLNISNNTISTLDISLNTALKEFSCYGNLFTTTGYDSLMCLLPTRSVSDNAKFYPIENATSANAATFMATNSINAKNKQWAVNYADNSTIPSTSGTFDCNTGISVTVDMTKYITLHVAQNATVTMNFTGNATSTGIKIENGDKDTTWIINNAWTGLFPITANTDNLVIYGAIAEFDCSNNSINKLIVNNDALKTLNCSNNMLTILDVNNASVLENLNCSNNKLTSLDVSNNLSLIKLECYGNSFTTQAYDNLICSLPSKMYADNAKVYPLFDNADTNRLAFMGTNAVNNVTPKNWQLLFASNAAAITGTSGTFECQQVVNMNSYITINTAANSPITLSLAADKNNTPIKIVNGNIEDDHIVNTTYSSTININSQTTTITIYGNIAKLDCKGNNANITGLDIRNNISLEELNCADNTISTLDVSRNTSLQTLYCYGNPFTTNIFDEIMCSLPLKQTTDNAKFFPLSSSSDANTSNFMSSNSSNVKAKNWDVLYYNNGTPSSVPATNGTSVCKLDVSSFVVINLINNAQITMEFAAEKNNTTIKISSGTHDSILIIDTNFRKISYEAKENSITIYGKFTKFNCYNNAPMITSLNTNNNSGLVYLNCSYNVLTSLDIRQNTALEELNCANNNLTTIDLSRNIILQSLNCSNNNLGTIDVDKNTQLKNLVCVNTNINTLEITKNTALESLDCSNNNLVSLNTKNNIALKTLDMNKNQLRSLNLSQNNALNKLVIHTNSFTTRGYDSLMCSLPTKNTSENATMLPLTNSIDPNYDVFFASTSKNATNKGWNVLYSSNNSAIPATNGNLDCSELGGGEDPEDPTSISEVNLSNIALYPNPAKTVLNIENATEDVQIFDITGRLLINVENKGTNLLQINVSNLSKGMYFVKVGNYTTKFVKE